MNKAQNSFPATPNLPFPGDRLHHPHSGVRARQRQAFSREKQPYWEATARLDDMVTEMEGMARNPNATGAYAGSF